MMQLDKNTLEEGIGIIIKASNTDIISDIEELAKAVSSDGENDMKVKLMESCTKFQHTFNETVKPSFDGLISAFQGTYDIAELLERAEVGDISTVDASFDTKAVDPASVRL